MHGAAQPVAAAAAAADSSTAGPRGSKGTALKVTKRFFGRESKLLVWEVLYQLSISTSHTSLCLSSSLPREPVPRPPPSRLLGRGYFGGLCLFFVWYDDVLPTRSKIICRSVFDSFSVSLSAFLAKCVRDSQSSTLCPRVIECFSPCLVFFSWVGPPPAPAGRFGGGEEAISCLVGGSWGWIFWKRRFQIFFSFLEPNFLLALFQDPPTRPSLPSFAGIFNQDSSYNCVSVSLCESSAPQQLAPFSPPSFLSSQSTPL